MEKISWTDRVRCEVLLHRVKQERNILHTVKRRKDKWIGHILYRNCLLKHATEGEPERMIEVTGRRGRNGQQLLYDLKEKRGYWKLKQEALDRTVCRTGFGRGCGPVVRQTTEWTNAKMIEWMNHGSQVSRHPNIWWKKNKFDDTQDNEKCPKLQSRETEAPPYTLISYLLIIRKPKWCKPLIWHPEDRASWYILIKKPTTIVHCTVPTAIYTGYADCLSASGQHNLYDIYLRLCVQC